MWGELMEKCLESMRQGEEAKIHLPGSSAPLAKLRLDSFTNGRDSWEMEAMEKEALAKEEHRRGTELFRAGNPQGAARCYGRALRLLLTLPPPGPPERTTLYANLAACQLLLGHPQLAAQSCDRVLEREPGHLKALYRRGVARAALGDLEKATADFKKVLAVDPKNRAAKEELGKVVIQGRKQDAGLARGLRKMFSCSNLGYHRMKAETGLCTRDYCSGQPERLAALLGPTLPSGKAPWYEILGSGLTFGGMFSSGCWPFFL